jgi:aryl-alcohol dehydrogenase-like predicted oxidoreductase
LQQYFILDRVINLLKLDFFSFATRDYFFDRFALSVGYRHIDCAKIYLNEKEVGQVFGQTIGRSVQREELFIVGKVLISYPCRFPENEHDFLK